MIINKRILLKISGEFLGAPPEFKSMDKIITFINKLLNISCKISIVVGGGNLIRGREFSQNRVISDQMGMIATIINSLAIQNNISNSTCFSSIPMMGICDQYNFIQAKNMFDNGRVVLFAGGIGNSHCSTDVCAVIRALEMECDFVLKMTSAKGIFDSDPKINPQAKFIEEISYKEVIDRNLHVMDIAAIAIARDSDLKILIFSLDSVIDDMFTNRTSFSLIRP
ncbi:uridine monophosphate kinase [Candidatus Gromoviella agglomerans]|uniref:uridine monophosphate kinase n=1 Tax=Candidatus Gromoviella agglomerans TaxID=2806609 RepID=UPI001E418CA4|nr:hypothetical protein [Candidatus Gromoviella agglomerans]UFX98464.1 UMP kinase [Candidatus Gromoviella agglomerans]